MAPYIVADGKDLLIHMHAGPIPNIQASAVGVGAQPPTLAVEESKWSTRKESKIWPRGRSAGRRPSASARPTRRQDRVRRCRQFDGTSPLSHLSGALPCPAAAPCQPVSRVLPLAYPPFPARPAHFPVREISACPPGPEPPQQPMFPQPWRCSAARLRHPPFAPLHACSTHPELTVDGKPTLQWIGGVTPWLIWPGTDLAGSVTRPTALVAISEVVGAAGW